MLEGAFHLFSLRFVSPRLNKYGAVVVNSYGVERIEALTHHRNIDIRIRARALLTAFFGTESGENELSQRIGGSVSSPSAGSSSTADSDPEEEDDEDSLFDFTVNSAEKCQCVACLDLSRLPDKRVKPSEKENGGTEVDVCDKQQFTVRVQTFSHNSLLLIRPSTTEG